MKFKHSLTKSIFQRSVLIVFASAVMVTPCVAQGFSVEGKSNPSVVGAVPFVSLQGRFSIALTDKINGFRPLTVDTPVGKMTGDAYSWTMKEGSYTVGYVDAPQSMEDAETSEKMFAGIRDGLAAWAGTKNGKLASERKLEYEKHPGLEVKLEFPEATLWQRFYVISSRLYQVILVMKSDQRPDEAVAVKALDSFKVLSDAEVSAALKAKAAAAEPGPLPQEPVAARVGSDAGDDGFHGEVKAVYAEVEDLSGTWSVQGRRASTMEYYDKAGNLTKSQDYDYKGNLSDITVYGYIDGARVSSSGRIEHEYNPPAIVVSSAPGAAKPKSDPRYQNKYTFRYDEQKRLVEKTVFFSTGETAYRHVYKYSVNQREELTYSRTGSPDGRFVYALDAKGNEVEKTEFQMRDGSVREKYSYTYEFDAKGNWIKRVTSEWVTKDGKSYFAPEYVTYRTITYY